MLKEAWDNATASIQINAKRLKEIDSSVIFSLASSLASNASVFGDSFGFDTSRMYIGASWDTNIDVGYSLSASAWAGLRAEFSYEAITGLPRSLAESSAFDPNNLIIFDLIE